MDDSQWIDNILIAFDEMDFMPTTLLPDPEKARAEWKANLVAAIKEMDNHICDFCALHNNDTTQEFDSCSGSWEQWLKSEVEE